MIIEREHGTQWDRNPARWINCAQCDKYRAQGFIYTRRGLETPDRMDYGNNPAFCSIRCHDRWFVRQAQQFAPSWFVLDAQWYAANIIGDQPRLVMGETVQRIIVGKPDHRVACGMINGATTKAMNGL